MLKHDHDQLATRMVAAVRSLLTRIELPDFPEGEMGENGVVMTPAPVAVEVDIRAVRKMVVRYASAQKRSKTWRLYPRLSRKAEKARAPRDQSLLASLLAVESRAARLEHIRRGGLSRSLALCEALCGASREAAEVSEARDLAELAVLAVERLRAERDSPFVKPSPGEAISAASARNLHAFALAHLGNAHRRAGDLRAAGKAFHSMAEAANTSPGELEWEADFNGYCPVALSLEASYLRAVRRLREAIPRHMTAIRLVSSRLAPKADDFLLAHLLIALSQALREMGRFEDTYRLLCLVRDTWQDVLSSRSRLWYAVHVNLADCLSHLGPLRSAEARRMVEVARRLGVGGAPADLRRLEWIAARLSWEEGRREVAFVTLEEVRQQFVAEGEALDAALTSLELAAWHAEAGETVRARALAEETLPLFQSEGIHREALAAAAFLRGQLTAEGAALASLHAVLGFLQRSRSDASMVFQPPIADG